MNRPVFLVGFMGSGKSTVGRLLAKHLGVSFVDLDDDIERAAGRTIAEVFAQDGEDAFRDAEHAALALRAAQPGGVVALGGGAFTFPRNRDLLRGRGVSIWLDCGFDRAFARVSGFSHRPLAQDPGQFRALFDRRQAEYAQADVRIPVESDDPEDAVRLILEAIR